jgi:CO/xanthine dehydrogenase Mo-binding subunit
MSTVLERGTGVFGKNERRVDGRDKVTGQAKYAADFKMEGMLHAAFVRSPVPHAKIVGIDTSEAKALAGVHAVMTGRDIGEHRFGRRLYDRPALCVDRVLFIGDVVAAVAAETREIADAAAAAIRVDYDELPAVFEPEAALEPNAIVLHEGAERYYYHGGTRTPVPHPNVQGRRVTSKGDLDVGFAKADRIFEHSFETPRYHGGYLEPRATFIWIDRNDIVHVVATNKAPFALREQLAICAGIPLESVRVEPAYIGGDFGAKGLSIDEFPCYFLARATKRPIKYVPGYLQDMRSGTTRHASRTTLRTGVTKDGRITAMDARIVFNGGAYAAGKPAPTLLPGLDPKLPYDIPAGRLERVSVYTNTVPGGHMRAPGDVQFYFAIESQIDMIARELGIDPLEMRLRNAVRGEGSDFEDVPYLEPAATEVLQLLREASHWSDPLPAHHGRGIALGVRHIGGGKAEVGVRALPSGTVEVLTGAVEQGMGLFSVLQRVVAATLGIEEERVRIVQEPAKTGSPFDPGAGGSRQTHVTGAAAATAAQQLRERLARLHSGWPKDDPLEVRATYEAVHGHEPAAHSFCGFVVEVAVDPQTGTMNVVDVVCAVDSGTVVNPVAHRGQLSGGFMMGLGHALTEELRVSDGEIVNPSLADYKIPTQMDAPPLRIVRYEKAAGPGPFGAKMAGEINTATVAPAIANAIAAACGARVTALPLTAERVLAALGPSGFTGKT